MNLTRAAFSTPKRKFLLPNCTIAFQQLSTSKNADSVFSSWRDLLNNPMDWFDHRKDKSIGLQKAKYPDFRHKTNGTGLWLNSAPKWVLEDFNIRKGIKEYRWTSLVQNPDKWLDNRPIKINVKAPDFMHKETYEGLWLDDAPKCVLTVLEGLVLETRNKEHSWKNLVANPGRWWDNRTTKNNVKAPDFRHKKTKEGLWLESSPNWVLTVLEELNVEMGKKEDSWMDLVENPCKWWDNRATKTNVKAPDFKNKETGEALWLDNAPKWVVLVGLN